MYVFMLIKEICKSKPKTMKKLFTTIVTAFSLTTIIAQPILQSSNVHTGIKLNVYSLSGVNQSTVTPSGANITWDLSAATLGSPIATFELTDMASTGYASQYPTANFAMKFTVGGVTTYNFSVLTSSVLEEMALNVGSSGLQTFINNRTTLPFPFTFNLKDSDTYQKTGQALKSITHNYDAYGTLKVGTASFTNVVRDLSTDYGVSETQGVWWNSSPVYPILQVSSSGINFYQLVATNGVDEVSRTLSFMAYPNPANSELNIYSTSKIVKAEITDLTGQLMSSSNSDKLDVSALSIGVYFIKVFSENGVSVKKFIKQ